jgi:hypothetical protein
MHIRAANSACKKNDRKSDMRYKLVCAFIMCVKNNEKTIICKKFVPVNAAVFRGALR